MAKYIITAALFCLTILAVFLAPDAKKLFHLLKDSAAPPYPLDQGLPLIRNLLDLPPHGCKKWGHWLKCKCLFSMSSSSTEALIPDYKDTRSYQLRQDTEHSRCSQRRPNCISAYAVDLSSFQSCCVLLFCTLPSLISKPL